MLNTIPPLFENTAQLPPLLQYIVQRRWIYHVLFWGLFVVVSIFSDWVFMISNSLNFLFLFINLAIVMLGGYFQSSFFMPRFLYNKKYDFFILGTVATYLLQSLLNYKLNIYIYCQNKAYFDSLTIIPFNIDDTAFFAGSSIYVFYLFFVPSVKIIKDILLLQQQKQAIEKENLEGDLQFLKGQLSPHLLFNTLNNLYGLALLKSDILPPLMLRLSDVMRYSLYETNQTYVHLNQEITYLKNYLELEKLRVGDNVKLDIDFPEKVDLKVEIAPMLLIVFIENAFKHSRHAAKENRYINMKLILDKTAIYFHIENSFAEKNAYFQISKETNSGIGLELTKRRLDLLYEKNYTLNIDNQEDIFKVDLKLNY
jgi:two-component system, LytTR family, sensor kinase